MRAGSQVIRGCARRSQRLQASAVAPGVATRKRATKGAPGMAGALDRRRTSRVTARRAEAVLGAFLAEALGVKPQRPAEESATESVRGRTPTFTRGRQRREEGALFGELPRELIRTGQGLAPRETEGVRSSSLKLWLRRQTRLYSIMLSAKVSAGQAAWKRLFTAKAREGGDSRTKRSEGCSWCRSVAEVG